MIDRPIRQRVRLTAVRNALRLDAAEDGIELGFAHLECIVMDIEPVDLVVEINRQRLFTRTGAKYPTWASSNASPNTRAKNLADGIFSCAGTIV